MKNFTIDNEPKIKSGFKIPDDYFENFSAKLLVQIPENQVKTIPFFANRKTWIYAAAAVFVLSISIPFYNKTTNSNQMDDVAIENYMANNNTITDDDLLSLLDENDIKNLNLNLTIDDELIENELVENKNIENYLIE
jgi:hypothetical protein